MTINTRIALRVPPQLRAQVLAAAAAEGVNMSEFTRRAIQYRIRAADDVRAGQALAQLSIPEPVRSRYSLFFRCPDCNQKFLKNRSDLSQYWLHYRTNHQAGE